MPVTYGIQPVTDPNIIRSSMLESLSDYYTRYALNTNFYYIISAYSDILTDIATETALTILDTGVDEARDNALYRSQGSLLSFAIRGDLEWGWDDYRFFLKVLFEAFTLYGSTKFGMRRAGQVATGVSPYLLEHYKYAGWILGQYTLGTTIIVETGDYIWNSVAKLPIWAFDFYAVWPQQTTVVWLVGAGGVVWRSTDAGYTWFDMSPPPVTNYWGVHGVGPQETWACGGSGGLGVISHWSKVDGWSFTNPVLAANIRGIWMYSDTLGYCIGSSWAAWSNGFWKWNGSSWAVEQTGNHTFYAIHGHVTTTGAIGNVYWVGNAGAVYKYLTDGSMIHTHTTDIFDIYAVHVINDDTVWVCGEDGHVSVSTDGGTTWITYHTGIIQDLKGIWVSDDQNTIRVVGDNGTLLISIDGGTTWNAETFQGSGQGLTAISMSNNGQMGYICGLLGTILQNNAQPLGYTLENGVFYSNGDLLYGTILESRHGRRNYVDVLVWNVYYGSTTYYGETTYSFTGKNYDLLWELLDSIKPAHIKLFLIPSFPFIMDYYYYYKDFYRDRLQKDHILQDVNEGGCIVVNGRVYGDSLSQVVIGEEELYIPQLD